MSKRAASPLGKRQRNAVERSHRRQAAVIKLNYRSAIPTRDQKTVPPKIGLSVPLAYAADRIPAKVREAIRNQVDSDEALSEAFSSRNSVVTLSTSLRVPSQPWMSLPLDGTSRLLELGDIFEDGAKKMNVDADIVFNRRAARSPAEKEELIASAPDQAKLNCLRVGNMPIDDETWNEPLAVRRDNRPQGVGYCWPALVWFSDDLKTIKFSRVHGYDFDDFCIGDISEGEKWNQLKFNECHFFGPLRYVSDKGEKYSKFVSRLKEHLKEDGGSLSSGMPFLPTYCFKTFNAAEFGLGLTKWPKSGVDVAVRCVNYYEADGELKNLSFPRDIRLVVKEKSTIEDLRESVENELDCREEEDGFQIDSARLLEERHKSKWELDFWIMPQRVSRKLYRYTEGKVSQFLDPSDLTRTKDKRLYMEAHVVPSKPNAARK